MENKKLILAQKFEQTFEYYNEVQGRIKEIALLIQNTLSNNSDFRKEYPGSKCWAGFVEFDQPKKKVIFRLMRLTSIEEGSLFCDVLPRLSLNVDNIENDGKLTKEIDASFANFLKEKAATENAKIESNGGE